MVENQIIEQKSQVCLPRAKLLKFSVLQTISVKNLHKKSKNTKLVPLTAGSVETAPAR
jgi:hypothetical protein